MAKRKAMVANSLGLENNQDGKLNAGAAKKRPAFLISRIIQMYRLVIRFLNPPNLQKTKELGCVVLILVFLLN
ncbi:hypothetical protein RDI58_022850 [Solanum bulbocastanum]|uniref:Uncharacterized protein n=1 Tax=Solanum bulbocastanum TaxID=147425 RepID=A0AAN8TBI7_SOLBU